MPVVRGAAAAAAIAVAALTVVVVVGPARAVRAVRGGGRAVVREGVRAYGAALFDSGDLGLAFLVGAFGFFEDVQDVPALSERWSV